MEPSVPSPQIARLRIRPDARGAGRRRGARRIVALLAVCAVAAAAWTSRDRFLGTEVDTGVVLRTGGDAERAILTANGYVTARRQAGVTAKVTGRIKVLHKDLGDAVERNEIIAELDDADVAAALEEVRATHWVNELTAERAKGLLEKAVGPQSEYDLALARVKETAARIKNLEEQIENTRVRAPFDGVIIVKNGEVGETVSLFGAQTSRKSGPIFVIADFREFEVEADVSESNIPKIAPGQPAEIALDAVPARRYRGRLRQIVPTADRQKATIQAKVSLLDPDERVYPEMSAKVTFLRTEGPAEPTRITAPASGIVQRGGRKVALVVEGDRVREVVVETGAGAASVAGDRLLVTSGLSGGESIVLSPPEDLAGGARIRPRSAR